MRMLPVCYFDRVVVRIGVIRQAEMDILSVVFDPIAAGTFVEHIRVRQLRKLFYMPFPRLLMRTPAWGLIYRSTDDPSCG